jgi:hypothetical protein
MGLKGRRVVWLGKGIGLLDDREMGRFWFWFEKVFILYFLIFNDTLLHFLLELNDILALTIEHEY